MTVKTKVLNFFRQIFLFGPLEKILVSLNKGKEPTNFFAKFVPNHYQYKKGTIREAIRDNISYRLDLSDIVDWYIYYGFLDPTRPVLFSHIKEGDSIIDVGANMGETSFNFSRLVGEKGNVIGFEPDKDNFRRLMDNLKLNNFKNLDLINKGIGHQPGKFLIKMNETEPGNAGSKRIIGKSQENSAEDMIVEVIKLDDFLKEKALNKIDLIKMDIEGYEMNAILGAKETIRKYRPKMFLELHDVKLKEQGYSGKHLVEELTALNYQVLSAETNEPVIAAAIPHGAHFDIICTSN